MLKIYDYEKLKTRCCGGTLAARLSNQRGQEDCAGGDDTISPTCWAKLSSVSEADSTLLRLLER